MSTQKPGGTDWLEEAKQAAAAGDPVRMVEALYRSDALAGLARRLQAKWDRLSIQDVEDVVGAAADVAYEAAQVAPVLSLVAFLWKVADRKASDLDGRLQRERATDLLAAEDAGQLEGAEPIIRDADIGVPAEIDYIEARKWALATARSLLPQLGQRNAQAVMGYVLDAIEKDAYEVTNEEIETALGLSNQTVRTSLSRGFSRLARLAEERKIVDFILEIQGVMPGEDDEVEEHEDEDEGGDNDG